MKVSMAYVMDEVEACDMTDEVEPVDTSMVEEVSPFSDVEISEHARQAIRLHGLDAVRSLRESLTSLDERCPNDYLRAYYEAKLYVAIVEKLGYC